MRKIRILAASAFLLLSCPPHVAGAEESTSGAAPLTSLAPHQRGPTYVLTPRGRDASAPRSVRMLPDRYDRELVGYFQGGRGDNLMFSPSAPYCELTVPELFGVDLGLTRWTVPVSDTWQITGVTRSPDGWDVEGRHPAGWTETE